jgi:predicted enzyme related to lactoylglutathione lyase
VTTTTPPTYRTGKICYLEIALLTCSSPRSFYRQVFGWTIRRRGDGATAFDDTVDEVSGAWVLDRPPATAPGLMVYIMVGDAAAAVEAVPAAGGEIVRRIDPNSSEVFACFRDPAGNVLGIYQQAGLAEVEAGTPASVHSAFHNPNTPPSGFPLVSGRIIRLPGHHAKVCRDGYRKN